MAEILSINGTECLDCTCAISERLKLERLKEASKTLDSRCARSRKTRVTKNKERNVQKTQSTWRFTGGEARGWDRQRRRDSSLLKRGKEERTQEARGCFTGIPAPMADRSFCLHLSFPVTVPSSCFSRCKTQHTTLLSAAAWERLIFETSVQKSNWEMKK